MEVITPLVGERVSLSLSSVSQMSKFEFDWLLVVEPPRLVLVPGKLAILLGFVMFR